ncbi:flagellin [Leisingera sp. HS039]|uniref:flagellin N-terminal helical domain-containing protein n=1 Tax=unclassified Leisingera TaxID=2614906 RepID=UPI0010714D99|nr:MULTISPECIES: flagellin [unclassified Leisingera]MBQ4825598.1 flagellin [Leisingera sp. HS039]QBR37980.1 flagellin [Leisingera sp. NJS201]
MTSILTNNGAMVALQTLRSVNDDLGDTQNQISTGKEIGSAKDNSAVWSISKSMESDIQAYEAVGDALNFGEATVAVASSGAEQIVEVLKEMKELIVSANSQNVDHSKIQNDIVKKQEQITAIISSAEFNGANLLNEFVDAADSEAALTVLGSVDGGTTISVAAVDMENDLDWATTPLTAITDAATASTALGEIDGLIAGAIDDAAALGADAKRITDQNDFVSKLTDSLKTGVSAMTDTNMEEASARLKALQTQQQLAVQSLTIANQAPSTLQQLFR